MQPTSRMLPTSPEPNRGGHGRNLQSSAGPSSPEVEGTQPDTPPVPAPSPRSRRNRVLIVLALAVIVAVAGVSVYVLTRPPPILLTIRDGSATGAIEGNFTNYTDTNAPLVRDFTAATYANQGDGPISALALRLRTDTVYNAAQGWVDVYVDLRVQGTFASDLHLGGLTVVCNQTGELAEGTSGPNPTNVSSDPAHPQMFQFSADPGTFTPTLMNQTGRGPFYEFLFPAAVHDAAPLAHRAIMGFRATVTGSFTPAVSVGILLNIIDVPSTTSAANPPQSLGVAISKSSDGSNWVLTFTSVPSGLSNTTPYLTVLTSGYATAVPVTALGSIYTSAYGSSVVYSPATLGSSTLSSADWILLSAATYPAGYQVQISTTNAILFSATLQ